MLSLLLLFTICGTTLAQNAVDISVATSQTTFSCLKQNGITEAFIRGYKPDNGGSFDQNCVSSINNANTAGVTPQLFIAPQPNSTKLGYDQADDLNKELKKNNIKMNRVWLQVINPAIWSDNQINNCGFINEVLMRSRANGYSVGVYTSLADWQAITGNWQWVGSDVFLCVIQYFVFGYYTDSLTGTFDDFQPFGAWTTPSVKQYGKSTLCSLSVGRDAYTG